MIYRHESKPKHWHRCSRQGLGLWALGWLWAPEPGTGPRPPRVAHRAGGGLGSGPGPWPRSRPKATSQAPKLQPKAQPGPKPGNLHDVRHASDILNLVVLKPSQAVPRLRGRKTRFLFIIIFLRLLLTFWALLASILAEKATAAP